MLNFIIQGAIPQAARDGDIKTLRDILDRNPDMVNITDWVCKLQQSTCNCQYTHTVDPRLS